MEQVFSLPIVFHLRHLLVRLQRCFGASTLLFEETGLRLHRLPLHFRLDFAYTGVLHLAELFQLSVVLDLFLFHVPGEVLLILSVPVPVPFRVSSFSARLFNV